MARSSHLRRDEARRIQAKQEAQWDRERLAREKLMNQVLSERAQQLEEKMLRVRRKQTESVQAREALLEQLDDLQQVSHVHPTVNVSLLGRRRVSIRAAGLPWGSSPHPGMSVRCRLSRKPKRRVEHSVMRWKRDGRCWTNSLMRSTEENARRLLRRSLQRGEDGQFPRCGRRAFSMLCCGTPSYVRRAAVRVPLSG